jgi:hypothetical protein
MNFDPRKLPPSVYGAYKMGAMAWPLVVEKAIQAGITDANKLADIVFYLHHPERSGRLLGPGETGLINQWKNFKNLIAPRVRGANIPGRSITDCEGVSYLSTNIFD